MEENLKSAPASQGDGSADKAAPKAATAKVTKSKEEKAADATKASVAKKVSETSGREVGIQKPDVKLESDQIHSLQPNSETSTGTKVEKHDVTDPVAKAKGEAAEAQAEKQDFKKEAQKVLKAAAAGTETVKVSHKAAVIAINTPGVVYDQEAKTITYQGGKTQLVIE